jgi:hypothetical protein
MVDLNQELQATARVLLRIANRRARVVLFARATRTALDVLPSEHRGPAFVPRSWELPAVTRSDRAFLQSLQRRIDQHIRHPSAHVMLFSHATQLAIEDLSPDEQNTASVEATQIIGSPTQGTLR